MTPDDIDKLESGRELDALIAERIFNLDAACWIHGCEITAHKIPEYSADIAAAWQVVEKLREIDKLSELYEALDFYTPWEWLRYTQYELCLRIGRAALKAVAVQQDNG